MTWLLIFSFFCHGQLLVSETRSKSVVLTGHSMGGCVASLVALHFLCASSGSSSPSPASLLCITFGSPLLGDDALSRAVLRERWSGRFCHVVAQHDIMPRLLLCPVNSMPPRLVTSVYDLMQSWHFALRYPGFSRPSFRLSDDQRTELHRFIGMHVAAAEQQISPYRPFGNHALCSPEGAACIDDPLMVVKLLHLTFMADPGSSSIEEQHISYGDLVAEISQNVLSKKRIHVEEEPTRSSGYSAGVSMALEASGIRIQVDDCSVLFIVFLVFPLSVLSF